MATHSCILAWRIPTDRGAWQATVHGVAKSLTQLSYWACTHSYIILTSLTIFKCTIQWNCAMQWYQAHSKCYVTIITAHLQKFFIIPNRNSIPNNTSLPLTFQASLVAQTVKNLPAIWETWVWYLGWEDPLEEGMKTHSCILAWRIPTDREAWQSLLHFRSLWNCLF